jgi:hypothetical protein
MSLVHSCTEAVILRTLCFIVAASLSCATCRRGSQLLAAQQTRATPRLGQSST